MIVISCGKCDKVLNFKRWVRVERMKSTGKELTGAAAKFYRLLPHALFRVLIRVMLLIFGGYLVKTSSADADLPEIIDSYFTQIERISSLHYDETEQEEIFIRRAIGKIVEDYPPNAQ